MKNLAPEIFRQRLLIEGYYTVDVTLGQLESNLWEAAKPKARRKRIPFINAVNEVTREHAQSFLTEDHIQHIVRTYEAFADEPDFRRLVSLTTTWLFRCQNARSLQDASP